MRALAVAMAMTGLALLPAQNLRLVDRVASPLMYLAAEARDDKGGEAYSLLDDPALLTLMGMPEPSATASPSLRALEQLKLLLEASTGEMELALAGLLPRFGEPDLPLMIFRARLGENSSAALARALERGELARPNRKIGDAQIFSLSSISKQRAGRLVEVALVGQDLFVSNHGTSMEEVFCQAPQQTSSDPAARPVLAADPGYVSLRSGLAARHSPRAAPGSVVLYVDWARLWTRVEDRLPWAERLVLEALGLGSAEGILVSVRPDSDRLRTTILIDQPQALTGLLEVIDARSVRKLVQDLPVSGVGALALSLDLQRLARPRRDRPSGGGRVGGQGPGYRHHRRFIGAMLHAFQLLGIDPKADIVSRLGKVGSVQLIMLGGPDRLVGGALTWKARSSSHARALFEACEKGIRSFGILDEAVEASQLRRSAIDRMISIATPTGFEGCFALLGDALALGMQRQVLESLGEQEARLGRSVRIRRRQAVLSLLQHLGSSARKVAGVFTLDLADGSEVGGEKAAAKPRPVLARQHAGLVFLDSSLSPDASGSLLRIEMVTTR